MTETASKARNMVGIGPITANEVELQRKSCGNYEMAKRAAVNKFMRIFFKNIMKGNLRN